MQFKRFVVACMVLVLILAAGTFVSFNVVSVQGAEETVTYDYHVVAGYNMTPTPPSPEASPAGFNFTVTPSVYNFGNITRAPLKTWLYEGTVPTPYGSAYATVKITNLLRDITVVDLTVEVTAGTPIKHFYFPLAGEDFGNFTLLNVDALDPYNASSPYPIDECNYNTGVVTVYQDGDWTAMEIGTPYPEPDVGGPLSLLQDDVDGDAKATGHVKPIQLANGSTLTEYFGIIIFGDTDLGTQINGTITLSLTYNGAAEFPWLWIGVGVVVVVVAVAAVAILLRRRK